MDPPFHCNTDRTSQLPLESWHDFIADGTLADAILDRLVHNAYSPEDVFPNLRGFFMTHGSAMALPLGYYFLIKSFDLYPRSSGPVRNGFTTVISPQSYPCLLYTSDAADE